MRLPSENPSNVYKFVKHNALKIYFNADDRIPVTVQTVRQWCNDCNINYKVYLKIYYLRGHRNKAAYDQVIIGALEPGKRLPKPLWEVIHCVAFWNQEGIACHQMNGDPGESYQEFILKCMACDCRVFVEPYSDQFITGKGGNHVWIGDKLTGERILIFHFVSALL